MAGNATVTLYNGNTPTVYEVWMQAFATGTNTQFVAQQTRDYVGWIPIRRSEMFANFTIVWPLISTGVTIDKGFESINPQDGFAKMNAFQEAIRVHQVGIVNGSINQPMVLNYLNNSDSSSPNFNTLISTEPLSPLNFSGWIQNADKQYIKYQNVFVMNYTMNILTKNTSGITNNSGLISGSPITYAPTASDQGNYGSSWVNLQSTGILANAIATGNQVQSSESGSVPNG
jgi:hypothetical protein